MVRTFPKFVIVGISGGVDSAVAALLLKKQGFYVEAIFMQNWEGDTSGDCSVSQDLQDAKAVCKLLNIKLHKVNFAKEYWDIVFQYFLDEYAAGRTPNPDVLCNKEIKFKAFLDYAKSLGADFIATGHYARKEMVDNKAVLFKGLDSNKDQSYFLYLLNQAQLKSALFPIGELNKDEVRQIAQAENLPNHSKKDSTGICFIGERKFKDFLNEYLLARPGEIRTLDDQKVGVHEGLMFYTLGQRKGIGIGGKKEFAESPWYVAKKEMGKNILYITQDKEAQCLMSHSLSCDKVHWISGEAPVLPFNCVAKIRYRQQDQGCKISFIEGSEDLRVDFIRPQWAATPGQSIVFYDQDRCLGGGIIKDLHLH